MHVHEPCIQVSNGIQLRGILIQHRNIVYMCSKIRKKGKQIAVLAN